MLRYQRFNIPGHNFSAFLALEHILISEEE